MGAPAVTFLEALSFEEIRLVTAAAFLTIGATFAGYAIAMLGKHPIERVWPLAPYVSKEGFNFLNKAWPGIMVVGVFSMVTGATRIAYYLRWKGFISSDTANLVGLVEAGFAVGAACCVIKATRRLWRKR